MVTEFVVSVNALTPLIANKVNHEMLVISADWKS